MEVVHGPSRREAQREFVRRLFSGCAVMNCLQDRPAPGVGGAVLLLGDGAAGDEIVSEGFASVRGGVEVRVRVEPRLAIGGVIIARPLDAVPFSELVV